MIIRKNWRNLKWVIFTRDYKTGVMEQFTQEFKDYVHLISFVEHHNSVVAFRTNVKIMGYEPAQIEGTYVTL